MKELIPIFGESEPEEIHEALAAYLSAFIGAADGIDAPNVITKPQVFRAVMLLFTGVGQRVKDKYGKAYEVQNFSEVLQPMFTRVRASALQRPETSYKELHEHLSRALRTSFTL